MIAYTRYHEQHRRERCVQALRCNGFGYHVKRAQAHHMRGDQPSRGIANERARW